LLSLAILLLFCACRASRLALARDYAAPQCCVRPPRDRWTNELPALHGRLDNLYFWRKRTSAKTSGRVHFRLGKQTKTSATESLGSPSLSLMTNRNRASSLRVKEPRETSRR
jgi:hypothetical protein